MAECVPTKRGEQGMSLWNAFSTCWPPGQGGCVVWWDAWAAIGTTAGVLVALIAPMVRKWKNAKRINAMLALQFADEIAIAGSSLAVLERDFPLIDADTGLATLRKLNHDPVYRNNLKNRTGRLETVAKLDFPLSSLPAECDLRLALLLVSCVHTAKAFVQTVQAIANDPGGRSEHELVAMLDVFRREYRDASDALAAATKEIQTLLKFVPSEWGRDDGRGA
ncbi:hypothetical protein D3C81_1125970 [compost metagenome]